ncbi:oocyte zinc finger protein XlCOF6-like isoform X2 [Macrosteles quadrilineatus]|uniref:oocyte zinc finger protein XlCOF6-like isoform X2 n=1 Tax=Macrosteles quadrilineatus TaxID=74068 RepID=UPI0023E27AC7|nr:oocyte zinc finger protein XlCOF6-like isoform X2 [Macrosteles quadrilineatus]
MDLQEPIAAVFIKEEEGNYEFSIDEYLNSYQDGGIKQEPQDFSSSNSESENFEGNQFLLDLVNNSEKQSNLCAPSSDIKLKRKIINKKKFESNQKVDVSQETKGHFASARISRDRIFANKEYFCDPCQKTYIGRKNFKNHFKLHFAFTQDKYTCLICDAMHGFVGHMNRHIIDKHLVNDVTEKLFICHHCRKRFFGKRDLERHMFCHIGRRRWECNYCEYSCPTRHRLMNHMRSIHGKPSIHKTSKRVETDITEFICDYCNYITGEKAVLRTHIKRHMGLKSVKCPECNYECTTNGDLKKHSVIHSNKRPFVCDKCNKSFKRRSHLLIHFNLKYDCAVKKRERKHRA